MTTLTSIHVPVWRARQSARHHKTLFGAVAGAVGANCMTAIRLSARRAGLIDRTVPQAMEDWLSRELDLDLPGGAAGHTLLDQLLHVAYGAGLGAVFGFAAAGAGRGTFLRGTALGLATFLVGRFALMPLLEEVRPSGRATRAEHAVDLLAHLAFGWITAVASEELARQHPRPLPRPYRRIFRTG
jgi:hypothetical protein